MRIILLGGPGSGKGTQLRRLSEALQLPSIAVGDVLRDAIAQQTRLGTSAQPYVEKGELVPDNVMIQFMRLRLLQEDVNQGWMMEGYPRTAFQAEELDFVLSDFGQYLTTAVYLEVSEEVMRERSKARFSSGDATRSRADDTPDILQRRIQHFRDRTIPILEYYGARGKLLKINAEHPPDTITQEILQKLKS
ncbi:nucleoside monophosphate kinase [Spirulina sp. CS-785/01]|uniref:adenylate kinase family protein n=1 Tax=Spirulina sp. CS-785/01 TaxID=3021716 RepID=UPI00232BE3FF|nr:nucleoside monophosphate kinase [Spirulina sp. CS-785/01]MDB9315178.1 nucleoside monophosphate kinase [Spirulina sp. CS-785/01]